MPAVSRYERYNYSRGEGRKNTAMCKKHNHIRSMFTLLTVIIVSLLLIKTLILRIELTTVCDANVKAEQQLEGLIEEQRKLQIEYEKSIDLEAIDEYAKNELGMQKPGPGQKVKIDTETRDKVIIIDDSEETENELDHLIGCIKEYFN